MSFESISVLVYGKYLSVLLLWAVGVSVQAQEVKLSVISNTKGAPTEMKMTELKTVLKGEKQRWGNGTKVSIYLMKTTTPVGQSTCEKIYNMSSDKVRQFWLGLSFSGKADAPTFCNTVAELESYVSQTPGAIGILSISNEVDGVKIIMVDGQNYF